MKRVISIVISAMMVFALLPFGAMVPETPAASVIEKIAGPEKFQAQAATGDKYTVNISGIYDYSGPQEMMQYINEERQKVGVGTLTLDADLTDAAMQRAAEIAYYFSHTRPDNTKCYTVNSRTMGENIAAGNSTAKGTYTQWYYSQGHYENMVRARFTNIGIGHFTHRGTDYWVQMFSTDRTKKTENRTGYTPVKTQIKIVEKSMSALQFNGGNENDELILDKTLKLEVGAVNEGWPYAYCTFDADSFVWSSSDTSVATVDSEGLVVPAGPGEVTITAKVGNTSTSMKFRIGKDIYKAEVAGLETVEYTGSEHTPDITVTYDGVILKENQDYTIEYSNNINVGYGKVKITGMGDYLGEMTKYFTIERKSLANAADIQVSDWHYADYDSAKQCIEENTKVYYQGKLLELNRDYTIYSVYYNEQQGIVTEFAVGFKGNFTGSQWLRCLDTAYAEIDPQGYTGAPVEADFTLYYDSRSMGYSSRIYTRDVDYKVEYINNVEVGTATARILPTNRSFGSAEIEFRICRNIAEAQIPEFPDVEYTGKAFTPEVTVVHKGRTLQQGVDYEVAYSNNVQAGTASVTIQGIGEFAGSVTRNFEIHRYEWVIDKEATEISKGIKHLQCVACDAAKQQNTVIDIQPCTHVRALVWNTEPTCTEPGNIKYYICEEYGVCYTDFNATQRLDKAATVIPAKGHKSVVDRAVSATCTSTGLTAGSHCSVCGAILIAQQVVPVTPHNWNSGYTVDQPAAMDITGCKSIHCKDCNIIMDGSGLAIPAITSVTADKTEFVYNGSVRKPQVVILNADGSQLTEGADYSVSYKNAVTGKKATPKNVGKYTVLITFKGDYSGSVTHDFVINPKSTSINKLASPAKKQLKVTWQKRTVQVTGYQLRYSTKQNMTGAKMLKVKSYKTNSATIKQLKAKTRYYVQIRTYKTVNGKTYYSAWSAKKQIKTK